MASLGEEEEGRTTRGRKGYTQIWRILLRLRVYISYMPSPQSIAPEFVALILLIVFPFSSFDIRADTHTHTHTSRYIIVYTMTPPDPHPPSLGKSRSDNAVANSLNVSRSSTRVLYSSWLEPMPSAPTPAVGRTFLEQWIADQTPDATSKLAVVQLQAEVSLSGLPGAAGKKAEDVDEVTQGPLRRRWTTGAVEERPRSLELRGVGAFAEDAEPSR